MMEDLPEIPEYIKKLAMSGELTDEIRLDSEGRWLHNGELFSNKKIIDFFNRHVNITADEEYVIHYDIYTYPIIVEDTPVFITGVRFEGFGDFEKVYLNLSTGNVDQLDPDTLYYKDNNALYCRVSQGKFPAKFMRSPSFHILERLDQSGDRYMLNICGKKIELTMEGQL